MLERYFQHQASLSETEPGFLCQKGCDAPGCRIVDIIVEVTLFDLIRLNRFLDTPVSDLFSNCCQIGLENYEHNPRYKRLMIKLKKPCPFLQEDRCGVHGSKPLNCVLFPEFHQISGFLPDLVKRPVFNGFPCLRKEIPVSDQRKEALKQLKKMGNREEALSSYFLFGVPSCIIDFKPIIRRLKKESPEKKLRSIQDFDEVVHEQLKPTGFFDDINDKVPGLDSLPAVTDLFEKLKDDARVDPLVEAMLKPETVFNIKGNRVKRLRRSLQPPDVIFM